MNRKFVLAGVAVAAALILGTLAGCSGYFSPGAAGVNQQTGIWVSGEGKVLVTPDIADLSIGVQTQALTVTAAQSQAATAMDAVMKALTASGIAANDIQTQYYSITPQYRYDSPTGQPYITGYQVSNQVDVKIRQVANAGAVIDAVTKAGGNAIRINGINFTVDNPSALYQQARDLAMTDAKNKATELASQAGVSLGRATYINETSSTPIISDKNSIPPVAATTPTTPISPGQTEIDITVQVVYAIG